MAGLTLRDLVAQTTYASAVTNANANTTADVILPEGFEDRNTFVYLALTDSSGDRGNALVRTALLYSLTGSSFVSAGGVSISGHNTGQVFYQPSTRSIHIRISGAAPRFTYVGLIGTASGTGGRETFIGLTDTPAAYTDGQYLRMTATGITGVAATVFRYR